MATRWTGHPDEDDHEKQSVGEVERKDARRCSEAEPAAAASDWEEEPFSWAGPTTIRLARTPQGFGFTLRHFIVYPPESAVSSSLKDEDGSSGERT